MNEEQNMLSLCIDGAKQGTSHPFTFSLTYKITSCEVLSIAL